MVFMDSHMYIYIYIIIYICNSNMEYNGELINLYTVH